MRVADLMRKDEVHRLFVEDAGQLVDVVSQTDIVGAVATAKL